MTPMEWAVIAGGTALIAWINWYFFLAERKAELAGEGVEEK